MDRGRCASAGIVPSNWDVESEALKFSVGLGLFLANLFHIIAGWAGKDLQHL